MENELNLEFYGYQHYMALQYHMEEALLEKKMEIKYATCEPSIAIFSKSYYNQLNELNHNKIHDYCFIGSLNSNLERRKWVIEFAKANFTEKSIFVNTDYDANWKLLGTFDYSNIGLGFNPKDISYPENQSKSVQYRVVKENTFYFEKMMQSKYILCPAGDSAWSFRFYEALICKSIPIVESKFHTYRTKEEAQIKYKYILYNEIEKDIDYEEYIKINTNIFEIYHLLN